MRFRLFSLLSVLAALLVVGCGSSARKVPAPTVAQLCPAGQSQMGCASRNSLKSSLLRGATISGPRFPDVSSFQGHPNWAAAKPFITMASIKAGEFVQDPDFAFNVASLKANHLPWAPYWFVRNTGCVHEGQEIIAVIRSVGGLSSLPAVLDMEVPEAAGYAPCLANQIHAAFGRWPVIYTAPGTWPGGSNAGLQLWVADYGPSSPPCFWTCHPIAWQFTDGHFGFPVFIPGIGTGDVNADLGFSKLLPGPPPDPYAFLDKTVRHFGKDHASEYNTVKTWERNHCLSPARRTVCKTSSAHLSALAGRLWYVAHHPLHHGQPSWSFARRGRRFQRIWTDLHQARH